MAATADMPPGDERIELLLAENRNAAMRCAVLLATLIEEIRELRRDLAGRKASRKPRVLSTGDLAVLSELLPRIAAIMGVDRFTVRELREEKSLRKTIAETGLNPLQLGHLLRRATAAGAEVCGLHVRALGASREGVMFSVDAEHRKRHMASGIAPSTRANLEA